eukprot:2912406-Karenia_brevis.AAC.1
MMLTILVMMMTITMKMMMRMVVMMMTMTVKMMIMIFLAPLRLSDYNCQPVKLKKRNLKHAK